MYRASVRDLFTCRDIVGPDNGRGELPDGQAGNRIHDFVWKNVFDKIYLNLTGETREITVTKNLIITQDHVRSEVR